MIKNMDKYVLLKRFRHDCRLQFYMYDLLYVDSKIIPVEDYFLDTFFLRTIRNCQLQYQSQNIGLDIVRYE